MAALVQGRSPAPPDLVEAVGEYVASTTYMPMHEANVWLARVLGWHQAWRSRAAAIAAEVLEALLAVGVFGTGAGFGHTLLVPLAPRSTLVPGVGPVRIAARPIWRTVDGDSGAFPGAIFSPAAPGEEVVSFAHATALPLLDHDRLDALAEIIALARSGVALRDLTADWQKRLVVLSCGFDPVASLWRMDAKRAAALLSWAGFANDAATGETTDPDQALVIALPAGQRAIVTAGPGSGKTYVVCQRLAHLLDSGISAPRMWLLSFTRVAVEELRDRIAAGISRPDEARALNVATFDSFASRLLNAALPAGAQRPRDHDAAVRAALQMLKDPPAVVIGFAAGLAHVVIDEAQDLLGDRLELMRAFFDLLPPGCGVTILGDAAQSIYRFSLNNAGNAVLDSLLDPRPGFAIMTLGTDHRTRDPDLAAFFTATRVALGAAGHSGTEAYARTRQSIERLATSAPRGVLDPVLPPGQNSMVLFRGRRALLAESHRLMSANVAFRLRPSGQGDLIQPWIGALLAGLPGRALVPIDEIAARFDLMQVLFEGRALDEVWSTLNQLADSPGVQLDTARLQRRIGQSLPPRLLRRFLGHAGPLLGTIHGAKGLEADNVLLMLPYAPPELGPEAAQSASGIDLLEEARTLYVGATRARVRLYIGSQRPSRMQMLGGERFWRGHPGNFSAEIGREGDVLPFLHIEAEIRAAALVRAAEALAAPGPSPKALPGVALRDGQTGAWAIFRADALGIALGPPLGQLSANALRAMARIAGCDQAALPGRIGGFFLSGAATCPWSEGDDSGIALVPVLCGLASISLESDP
ncbi:UvrD-helicase domain-containing protein [Frigidibacter albus]|nr:UvrD-helicase domain-containing protein [Frigidibacter albus]